MRYNHNQTAIPVLSIKRPMPNACHPDVCFLKILYLQGEGDCSIVK